MNNNNEQNNIVMLYGALWANIILLLIPKVTFAIVGTTLLIILLIISYIIKKKHEDNSFSKNHSTFIIKSIWFGAFILPALTLTIAIIYLLPNYDPSAMSACAQQLNTYILSNPQNTDMSILYRFIYPCMDNFMKDNGKTLLISGFIAALPVIIYLIYRFTKGTIFAIKNKLITKPNNWIL